MNSCLRRCLGWVCRVHILRRYDWRCRVHAWLSLTADGIAFESFGLDELHERFIGPGRPKTRVKMMRTTLVARPPETQLHTTHRTLNSSEAPSCGPPLPEGELQNLKVQDLLTYIGPSDDHSEADARTEHRSDRRTEPSRAVERRCRHVAVPAWCGFRAYGRAACGGQTAVRFGVTSWNVLETVGDRRP